MMAQSSHVDDGRNMKPVPPVPLALLAAAQAAEVAAQAAQTLPELWKCRGKAKAPGASKGTTFDAPGTELFCATKYCGQL